MARFHHVHFARFCAETNASGLPRREEDVGVVVLLASRRAMHGEIHRHADSIGDLLGKLACDSHAFRVRQLVRERDYDFPSEH